MSTRKKSSEPTLAELTADDILNLQDVQIEEVDMSKWWPGKKTHVRSMTAADRDAFEAEGLQKIGQGRKMRFEPNLRDARARLLVKCWCDAAGKLLFSKSDVPRISKLHSGAIEHLADVARRINGMGATDDEEDNEQESS